MPVQTIIKLRRDTAANWLSTNPVLAAGEQGYETNTGLSKIGNGTAAWDALPYVAVSRIAEEVKNSTGATIAKGAVVYISGATGDNALIALADADTEATSSRTLGLVAAAIADGANGMVVCEGLLSGVNTGSATAGQSVWLSSTAGGFVFNTPPAKPAHSVYLGVVIRAHSVNGEILVKVQNGYELNELHDVNAGSPSDNNLLAFDSTSQMWTNQTAAQAGVAAAVHTHAQSDVTNLVSDLAGKAPTSHTHTQAQVTNLTSDLAAKANLSGASFTGNITTTGSISSANPNTVSVITSRINNGFYEQSVTSTANGWPVNGGWYHLISSTHSNLTNYYAMQFAADFGDSSNIFFRSTGGNGNAPWRKMATGIGAVTYSTGDPSGGADGDVWLKYTP
jgi:hypothetical protein